MAALYMWYGLVLSVLTCLSICSTEAKCRGRTVLTDPQGSIKSGPDICEWLIKGPYPNVAITITLTELHIKCSYEFLYIYDGDSYLSPLIASIRGITLPSPIVAHSGKVLINLYHDQDFNFHRFTLNYTIENCTNGCSGQGSCVNGYCQCNKLYLGKDCDLHACPSRCLSAEGHGKCNFSQGYCECNPGFIGESCSLSTMTDADSNKWFNISSTSLVFTPRIAHSVLYVERSDTLLAFGGYNLSTVFDDLLRFDFKSSTWTVISPRAIHPSGRFSHSANLYGDSMVLFGGESQNGSLHNDLWLHDITHDRWTELTVNDTTKPPPVTEHTATVVDDKLYIFGGRTTNEGFSSAMYWYSLVDKNGWTKVSYKRGNQDHLRRLGHSALYYPNMSSIIVFGGVVPEGPKTSVHSNKLLAFQVDLEVWSELAITSESGEVPKGRSFHSSVLVGDYLIIYGGNIAEQQCYENKPFFYHLKCQKWISQEKIATLSPQSSNPQQGRFSHGAVLRRGNVMLVTGGFSGLPLGDVLGYKLPVEVAANNSDGRHCGDKSVTSCKNDPLCGLCSSSSQCVSQSGNCSGDLSLTLCQGQCAVFTECSSCLLFGGGNCGWCVQDSRCYPTASPSGACETPTSATSHSLRGWWGDSGQFLTSVNHCQTMDFPPGITVVENEAIVNDNLPDHVRIASLSEVKVKVGDRGRTQLTGFVYPFKYLSVPFKGYALSLELSTVVKSEAKLWLSTDEREANIELVASCKISGGFCQEQARRFNNKDLFPSPSENKKYFIKAEVVTYISSIHQTMLSIKWNRSSTSYTAEPLTGQFLQPYQNANNCSVHRSCLSCMTNAACGWCASSCISRNTSEGFCFDPLGNQRNLTLNLSACTVCSDHIDCFSCNQDGNCVWGTKSNLLGCYRLGIIMDQKIDNCSNPCVSRKTCDSCVVDNVGCTWCDNTQSCFMTGTITSQFRYGQCSYLIESGNQGSQCPTCEQHTSCKNCFADFRCGWCGNDYDPRIGRCFPGDFNSPSNGLCSTLFPTNGSTVWSYSECPDVDECKLGIAECHHNATCINAPESFSCICNRGYSGNGSFACNKTCFHDCGIHGKCASDYTCDCDLGWLGENCSIDCGCHGHSDCSQGIGICDSCQDNTDGDFCQLCKPGYFGNATASEGCKPCQCNSHGDPSKNLCNVSTGQCFCMDFTLGPHCSMCEPGLQGDPKDGGLCFHECSPRSILINITEGYISTKGGKGVSSKSAASCLWLISALHSTNHEVVYGPSPPPVGTRGNITLTLKDIQINCLTDHVDVYDGLPPYLLEGLSPVKSFQKIGSFCGFNATNLKHVTAKLGNMVVVIKANLSSGALSKGFSAKFSVNKCPGHCEGNQRCAASLHGEQCVCLEGWTGPRCDQSICPNNCSFSKGQGQCKLSLESCVCSRGFVGQDCSQVTTAGTGVWETLSSVTDLNLTCSHLARMGHTMVEAPGSLIVFGGYSLAHGLLSDILSFNLTTSVWSCLTPDQGLGSLPTARFLHSAVFYKDSLLIYGGQMENGTADQSLFQFNTSTLQWSKLNSQGPKVAGHSATLAGKEMVIIGGYDRLLGFSETTYKYNVETRHWSTLPSHGPSPKGLYGHSAVYYAGKRMILVFGGYRFRIDSVSPSDALYSLDMDSNTWHLLQALPSNEPQPKYFHTATIVNDTMVVFGGRSNSSDQLFSHQLLLYNIHCNYWYLFPDQSLLGNKPGGLVAASALSVGDKVYSFGGFNGQTLATLSRFTLPSDLCQSVMSKEKCIAIKICSWCEVLNVTQGENITVPTNQSACHLTGSAVPDICQSEVNVTSVSFHNGSDCIVPFKRSCGSFHSCSSCLATFSLSPLQHQCGDAGWNHCVWSETLGQCFSPSYLPIVCLAGRCGQIIGGSPHGCLDSCAKREWCSTCLKSSNCGWCAEKGTSGRGQCLQGGLQGPFSETCDANNGTSVALHIWASTWCPLEDECRNGRHQCDLTTQVCVDTPESYKCECKEGYSDAARAGTCEPVCSKGCEHGLCVFPEKCVCHFGYTSMNCSIKCHCNNHGQCANETLLDVCHNCTNHTVGRSCEFCEPLYVGNAKNNGTCSSCYNVCNKRADVCMNLTMLEYGLRRNLSFELTEVKNWLGHGPISIVHDKECLCRNNSIGVQCRSCSRGFFELSGGSCSSCLCNGHADFCDNKTGTCKCQNNTEEDCSRSPGGKECYENQCVKCKSQFMGSPLNNQQCYRKMIVSSEFVIGLKTDLTDESDGKALPYGQAIMYAVYPRFTNVDIRLTIDVFVGEIDVYVANENDEFTVLFNHTTGHHQVNVKGLSNIVRKKRNAEGDGFGDEAVVDRETASSVNLNTFVTYNDHHRALIVQGVRKRLVLTFPYNDHILRDTRFYMVFIGRDMSGTKGLVYFKQDISQIDLFVFFSVFFSSFFLVVSVSVFAWKMKQYHTRRRVIEHRVHQLETMRSRPFATYSFLHQTNKPQPCSWRIKRDTAALLLHDPSKVKQHPLKLAEVRRRPLLAPVSQEPTNDGRASVTTVIFQLPGNECSDVQLLLGSSLTLPRNQYFVGGSEHFSSNARQAATRRTVTFTS
ncbi:multiple epidermal growth factor-like domains protein 8 isoform X4 [Acropora palmata]|uniref:multiple epidermal growth factor-like domains protein 8 isoform X4 n=1 Tax=Acropora palmata TaxID=6131 RepID=UPI003D9FF812